MRCERGYLLLAWLIAVAGLAALSSVWVARVADEVQREREQELLRVGDQIAGAIAAYRRASAGTPRKHPAELDELLDDRRAFGTARYLRRIDPDPIGRGRPWGIVRAPDGGVMGVFSLGDGTPFRRGPVALRHADLAPAARYADWIFTPREALP